MKETNKEKEKMNKEIKTNQKKIEELQKKLGIKITPIKEVKKPISAKPKPKPQPKKKPIVKKIAKKVVKIAKKVENKKKEEKTQTIEEKGILNINNLTQNISEKIEEIGKVVLPLANQIVNKITENLEKKEIKI